LMTQIPIDDPPPQKIVRNTNKCTFSVTPMIAPSIVVKNMNGTKQYLEP
jgi:hypothetical protein